jgi:integrase
MLTIRKRGKNFHADLLFDDARVRGSLGTRNQDAARRLVHRLETALSEGPGSALWLELSTRLPRSTFVRFADLVGFKERQLPTWSALRAGFGTHMDQQTKKGKLRQSTVERYETTLREFDRFLTEQRISLLQDITKPLVEVFKVWRIERIKKRKQSRGATGLVLDAAILHRVFAFAFETEMITKNPVRLEGRPGENPQRGAEPFTSENLSRLRDQAGSDLLTFLLLRWTGLRGSDAVALTWQEVHFDSKEIERVTRKRRKRVILPVHVELLFALESEHEWRNPQPTDRVLLNPSTGNPLSRPRLYERMLALGRRTCAGFSPAQVPGYLRGRHADSRSQPL